MSRKNNAGGRAAGCIVSLVGFVVMIVAFVVLIFFMFSGLSYFLDGEQIELPEFSALSSFVSENIDDFFKGIDSTISEIPEIMNSKEDNGIVDSSDQTDSEEESDETDDSSDEGCLTVLIEDDGMTTLIF